MKKGELLKKGLYQLAVEFFNTEGCIDCFKCENATRCFDCFYSKDITDCKRCDYCYNCTNCEYITGCTNCVDCKFCYFSNDLNNATYVVYNIQLTEEEFKEFINKEDVACYN
jgi:hypothetical protein